MGVTKYNGVMLPSLPDYDREAYPYALILAMDGGTVLFVCDDPFTYEWNRDNTFTCLASAELDVYVANMDTYKWEQTSFSVEGVAYFYELSGEYIWSNNSILIRHRHHYYLPEWNKAEYPYLIIVWDSFAEELGSSDIPTFYAHYSAQPFVWDDFATTFEGMEGLMPLTWTTDVIGTQYQILDFGRDPASPTVNLWHIDPDEGEFGYGYSSIQAPSNAGVKRNIWSNHEIVGNVNGHTIKEESWYELAAYEVGTTEEVPIPAPEGAAITGGNATYDQYTTASAMICTAATPEGGSLSYKWYRYTDSEENAVACGSGNSHTPSTATAGAWYYFVEVTNNQYGGTATVRSGSVPITINAVDLPDTPEATKASKWKYIIGYVLRQCGVPMAESVAEMLCKAKKAVETFNLADFSGEYDTLKDQIPTVDKIEESSFAIGECPLSLTTRQKLIGYDLEEADYKVSATLDLLNLPFRVGETIKLEVLFPKTDFGIIKYGYSSFTYNLTGDDLSFFTVDYNIDNSKQLSVRSSSLAESYKLSEITDSGNNIIGFVAELVFAHNTKKLYITYHACNVTNNVAGSTELNTTTTMTFSNYDDLKITRLKGVN